MKQETYFLLFIGVGTAYTIITDYNRSNKSGILLFSSTFWTSCKYQVKHDRSPRDFSYDYWTFTIRRHGLSNISALYSHSYIKVNL